MFVDRSVPRISREYERFAFAREMKGHLIQQFEKCVESGLFPATVPPAVAFRVLMAGVLGVAVLGLSDRLGPGEDPDDLASDVLEVTIAGLRSGVTFRSQSAPCPAEEFLCEGADVPQSCNQEPLS
jgi:hypothetical protein